MKAHEILEYTTKSGKHIQFEYHPDVEGDRNRGWRVDEVDAYVDGEYAGYIKATWIPMERRNERFPTIINFMSQIGGVTGLLPDEKQNEHYKDLTTDELKKVVRRLAYDSHEYHKFWNHKELIPNDHAELVAIVDYMVANELKKYKRDQERVFNSFLERPIVDFIRVFKKDEDTGRPRFGIKGTWSKTDFRRQRIGTALYLEMAKYLAKQGLFLHAASGQSHEAQMAWKYLEKMGFVKTGKRGRYIDPDKIPSDTGE